MKYGEHGHERRPGKNTTMDETAENVVPNNVTTEKSFPFYVMEYTWKGYFDKGRRCFSSAILRTVAGQGFRNA